MKIFESAEMLKTGKLSPVELAQEVLYTIKEKEHDIKVYITLCEDMVEKAKMLGENKENSLLWGIPVAIKDNICTEGIRTTAASKMLEDFVPNYDATVVKRLKAQGAVIIGKTNMDEFGMGSDSKFSAFKVTKNPINHLYSPGGSSGGSAAAVKSNMALGSIGTDTGGSVRQPAAFCGICALKPTYSLVSRFGLVGFASSLDCIGPMANCVRDLAIMTDCIAGFDKKDATSANIDKKSYFENLKASVKDLKIGVPKEFFEVADESVKKAVILAIKRLEEMGAKVEECSAPSVRYAAMAYYVISSAEASSNLARYDGVKYGYRAKEYESYKDMCIKSRSEAFGDEVKKRILLGTYVLSEEKRYLYEKANMARGKIKAELEGLLEKYNVLITPVSPSAVPRTDEVKTVDEKYKNDICTAAVSLAYLPAMSICCGSDENKMPIGMQIIGGRFKEQMLFDVALACEEGGLCDV